MSTLVAIALPLLALAQSDGGSCLRDRHGKIVGGSLLGLSTMKRIDDALSSGACQQAQQVLTEALQCASPKKDVLEALRARIARCHENASLR